MDSQTMAVLGFVVGLGLLWGYAGWLYLASRQRKSDNVPADRDGHDGKE